MYFDESNKNVKLVCKDNHVYVPLRSMAELFKFKVDYIDEGKSKRVDIKSNDGKINISLWTEQNSYVRNGEAERLKDEMKPFISEGRIYVPVRFLESFDMGVEYSSANSMIYIKLKNNEIIN